MDVHDRITTQQFKVDSEGRIVFYPYGIYGKGRILPDRATAEGFYNIQKQLFTLVLGIAGVLVGAYQLGVPFLWLLSIGVALGAVLCVISWFRIRALVQHLSISEEEYDFGASLRTDGRSNLRRHLIASLVFVVGSVWMLLSGGPEQFWIGVASLIFFGAAFLVFAWQAIIRAQRRRRSAAEPVQQIRQPRDIVVARSAEGFGKRKTPPASGQNM
jgi:hypothetical protein